MTGKGNEMKKTVLVFAAMLIAWNPDTIRQADPVPETQLLTRAAPTLATEGVSINTAITVEVRIAPATGGETLSGGGKVDFYFYNATDGWYLMDPDQYSWVMTGCAGKELCAQTVQILTPVGRMVAAANGVTVSSGTQVVVSLTVTKSDMSGVR